MYQKLKSYYFFLVWRVLTCALATDSLFDVLLVMPYYITKVIYPTEYLKGSAQAMVEFLIKSKIFLIEITV